MGRGRAGVSRRLRQLQAMRPGSAGQLHRFVAAVFGLDVPRQVTGAESTAPFDYLVQGFFEGEEGEAGETGDAVVWANRGGGKTLLGAVATLLDLIFKPGVQVRILGGSLEQSSKMYEHLLALLERPLLRGGDGVLAGEATQRRIELTNGSVAEILAQSQKSVRGTRVHKLRCDEVEEFDPAVWQAAQLVTRSGWCGQTMVRGTVEALSTMHRPGGLMSELVEAAADRSGRVGARLFKWNVMDVIGQCPERRVCGGCVLWADCGGRAKEASGFVPVADVIGQRQRTSEQTWAAEMMCRRPRLSESVYPNFEMGRHVVGDADLPREFAEGGVWWMGGMDFGLRCPTVMLWAKVAGNGESAMVVVMDEYADTGLTLSQHVVQIEARARQRDWPRPGWLGVDPAGGQRNGQTGLTDIEVLRAAGYVVRWRGSGIREGVERVRRRLDRGQLLVHRRCEKLIESLRGYHFDSRHPGREAPVKDGPDHACDALRYMVVNLERGGAEVAVRSYL